MAELEEVIGQVRDEHVWFAWHDAAGDGVAGWMRECVARFV